MIIWPFYGYKRLRSIVGAGTDPLTDLELLHRLENYVNLYPVVGTLIVTLSAFGLALPGFDLQEGGWEALVYGASLSTSFLSGVLLTLCSITCQQQLFHLRNNEKTAHRWMRYVYGPLYLNGGVFDLFLLICVVAFETGLMASMHALHSRSVFYGYTVAAYSSLVALLFWLQSTWSITLNACLKDPADMHRLGDAEPPPRSAPDNENWQPAVFAALDLIAPVRR